MLFSKAAIAVGGLLIVAMCSEGSGSILPPWSARLTAVIGGTVLLGSNSSTSQQTVAALKAAEQQRAELIGRIDLQLVARGIAGICSRDPMRPFATMLGDLLRHLLLPLREDRAYDSVVERHAVGHPALIASRAGALDRHECLVQHVTRKVLGFAMLLQLGYRLHVTQRAIQRNGDITRLGGERPGERKGSSSDKKGVFDWLHGRLSLRWYPRSADTRERGEPRRGMRQGSWDGRDVH